MVSLTQVKESLVKHLTNKSFSERPECTCSSLRRSITYSVFGPYNLTVVLTALPSFSLTDTLSTVEKEENARFFNYNTHKTTFSERSSLMRFFILRCNRDTSNFSSFQPTKKHKHFYWKRKRYAHRFVMPPDTVSREKSDSSKFDHCSNKSLKSSLSRTQDSFTQKGKQNESQPDTSSILQQYITRIQLLLLRKLNPDYM